jgi:hypothetical protein
MADEMKRIGRKLLIVSLGVASVSYAACGGNSSTRTDAAVDGAMADKRSESPDAGTDGSADASGIGNAPEVSPDRQFVGNLA